MFKFINGNKDRSSSPKRYNLSHCGDIGGPYVFGKRLKIELERQGWVYNPLIFNYNLVFVAGKYRPGKVNVLRLDGLYYDTENTVGDTDKMNEPIKKAYFEYDKIIFQSRFAQEMYFQHFGRINKPHRIIHNGVPAYFSPEGERYKYPFDKTLICSARWESFDGTHRNLKRLGSIIQGFKELKNKNTGLVILGGNVPVDNEDNIMCLGHIPHEKLPFYLRGADAFIHIPWLDCCPNTVVEALACGLPVLCGHNGGTPELVGDSGIILELEETYNLERVALYKPPVPDPRLVARGMNELLEWNKPVIRPDLHIGNVAKQYADFILEEQ